MHTIKGGLINNLDCLGEHIDREQDFFINVDEYRVTFNNIRISKNPNMHTCCILLTDDLGTKISLFDCYIEEYSHDSCAYSFANLVIGSHIDSFESTDVYSVKYKINSDPIPLLYTNLPAGIIPLNDDISIIIQRIEHIIELEIRSSDSITIYTSDKIFFNICDLLYLCLGFYPFIINLEVVFNGDIVLIFRRFLSIYRKGGSHSHWNKVIAKVKYEQLSSAYLAYEKILNKNNLIVSVLSNATHSTNTYYDITLSLLIQCTEGYMRCFHSRKRFYDDIKLNIIKSITEALDKYDYNALSKETNGSIEKEWIIKSVYNILSRFNSPDFSECINDAFTLNDQTKMIMKSQVDSKTLESFIRKSKNTRNQYSHMYNSKDGFVYFPDMILAREKYALLLRVIILSDISIEIDKSAFTNCINKIDENYKKQSLEFELNKSMRLRSSSNS